MSETQQHDLPKGKAMGMVSATTLSSWARFDNAGLAFILDRKRAQAKALRDNMGLDAAQADPVYRYVQAHVYALCQELTSRGVVNP